MLPSSYPESSSPVLHILKTVHSLTKYETPLVNLSPHPSLTLPYKGGKRSSFYNWRGFELVPCMIKKSSF